MTETITRDRTTRIGGTDVAVVFGLSPWKDSHTLWLEKTERLEPESKSPGEAADLGTLLESSIIDYAEDKLGGMMRDFVEPYSGDEDIGFPMAAQIDAAVIDGMIPVDAKTSGIKGPVFGHWGDEGTDEIPDYYLLQIQTQLICTGAPLGHVFALLGGRGIVQYTIPRSQELIDHIVLTCRKWWLTFVEGNIEPPKTNPPDLEIIKRIRRQPKSVVTFDDDQFDLVRDWELAKIELKDATKREKELKAKVLAGLGTAEAAKLPDGRMLTYFEQSRKGYTVEPSTYRTPKIVKGE